MQKTLLYLLLLAVLGGAAYYFVFADRENSAFPASEAGFTIRDTGSIGKIFLSQPNNASVLLERTDSGWIVNKKYKALNGTLNLLMECLYKQEASYPASDAAHNGIIKSMAGTGVKTEIYDRKGELIRTFYVGQEAHEAAGSYMLMQGAKKPYLVRIPGFDGFLKSRYNTDIDDWRDRTVFNFPAEEIQSVSINYPEEPLNSFTVTQYPDISVKADPNAVGTLPLNKKRVKDFLGFFVNVNCEGYLSGVWGIDTVLSQVPKKCTIDVVSKQGKSQHLDVYWMPINRRSKNREFSSRDIKSGYDGDRYYAVMNNFKDTAIIQQYNFGKIFRRAYEFYESDNMLKENK